ncbi:putative ATPase [Mycolicibacterium fortuitum]|uniref:Putative ATPase n=1 Tax=Mycolicibacterium fortuitum TaxID=1766 RepID=A0A378UWC8_MYCFO|nr:putative ATPase [Mycolicibacterium fortuitum]
MAGRPDRGTDRDPALVEVGAEEVSVGSVTLDDVGDMVETKQALTEAVLWPLQHPDTFQRLGVDRPGCTALRTAGCGKTFLVRALASSGKLSVHAVKVLS